jgi:hypothetical protein
VAAKDDALAVLEAALDDPREAKNHDRIRAVLQKHKTPPASPPTAKAEATPRMTVDLGLGPREYDDTDEPVPRVVRGLKRMGDALYGPALAYNKFIDTATLGLYGKGTDAASRITGTRIGPAPEEYERLARERPIVSNVATAAGYAAPGGLPAKAGAQIGRGVDALTSALARRATTAPARIALQGARGGITGAATGAAVTAGEGMVRGNSDRDIIDRAQQAAKFGAVFGAGANAAFGAGGELATAMRKRSPDLQVLHEAGLEPGPIPGRPVIREDQPIRSQLPGVTEPPLVGKATPATRASAGRVAADEIVPNITGRSQANNRRFGELQGQLYATEGKNPAPFQHLIADIDQRLANQSLPDATRAALADVKSKFEPYLPPPPPPQLLQLQQMLANASPASRAGIQQAINQVQAQLPRPKPFTARDLDQIRDYADTKIRSGEVSKSDVQFIQLTDNMRKTLADPRVAPGIADLNAQQHEILSGFGKRKALLGMKRNQRGEGEDVFESVARRASESGEETKAAGARKGIQGHAVERASALGAPPVLPGTKNLPPDVDYKSLLQVPRLQLAQENMQVSPSKLFSGAGAGSFGGVLTAPFRAASMAGPRLIYPLSRRAGNAELGGKGLAADELSGIVRRRGKKKREEEDRDQASR